MPQKRNAIALEKIDRGALSMAIECSLNEAFERLGDALKQCTAV